jgi:pyruvate/2-oxoglutarate dehydrogenase complex dihydrolipoamide dehydrogenase (E3) component
MAVEMAITPPTRSHDAANRELLARVRPVDWRNPEPKPIYDLVIVGSGPAGLAAANAAAASGISIALVEQNRLGGVSLNTGSIPSKAVLGSARAFSAMRNAEDFGAVFPSGPRVDFKAVMTRMRHIRTRVAEYHSVDRLCAAGVDVFFSSARFIAPNTLAAGDTRLNFRKALIATGARPSPGDIPGLAEIGYQTSETIFDIPSMPTRLAVIGGGPLGCEMAQAFCRLGSHVILLQNDPKFLPREERDAAELLSLALSRDGVETRLNTTVTGARMEGGVKLLDTVNNEVHCPVKVDEVLLSIGRMPNVQDLDLKAACVEFDAATGITVDDYLRTSNPDVYAAGDVCVKHRFANVAEATGRMAVRNAFADEHGQTRHLLIPWCTFCDPEIAHIGLYVWEAQERGIPVSTITIMMQDNDRAIADGEDNGFVKIHLRDGTDSILGATIVASRASEMINEMSVIMSAGIGMRTLADILHIYPAQSDAIRQAVSMFVRKETGPP